MKYQDYLVKLNEAKHDVYDAIKSGDFSALNTKVETVKNGLLKKISNLNNEIDDIKTHKSSKTTNKEIELEMETSGSNREQATQKILDAKVKELDIATRATQELDSRNTKIDAKLINLRSEISKIKKRSTGLKVVEKLIADGMSEDEAWEELESKTRKQLEDLYDTKTNLVNDMIIYSSTKDIGNVSNQGIIVAGSFLKAKSYKWTLPTRPKGIILTGGLNISIGKPESKLDYITTNKSFETNDVTTIKQAVEKIKNTELKIIATINMMFAKKGLGYFSPEEIEQFKTVKSLNKELNKEKTDMLDSFFDMITKATEEKKSKAEQEKEDSAKKEEEKSKAQEKEHKKQKIEKKKKEEEIKNKSLADLDDF